MDVTQLADFLDEHNIAILLLDTNDTICRLNKTAITMLDRPMEALVDKRLPDLMPGIYQQDGTLRQGYAHFPINVHIYVHAYPLHEEGEDDQLLVTIQDITKPVMCDVYTHICNLLPEAIMICDAEGRLISLNDANIQLEGLQSEVVLGKHVTEVYRVLDDSSFSILQTLETMQPKLNHRQMYATQYGRVVDGLTSTYPIFLNDQIFGTVSLVEDYTKLDEVRRKNAELEKKLNIFSGAKTSSKKVPVARYHFRDIICSSPKMMSLLQKCKLAAQSDSAVMLYGETGTGKELFAQSIHNASKRADRPFVAVNCAAIPDNLLESMLFGTVKGAFTGAENQMGLFEQAHSGTLLLDELNSMSMALQSKLLRVLQEGVVRRLGSTTDTPVDVRIISNINVPPQEAIDKGLLRNDLYYRLGVVSINILPLRERHEDIMLLVKTYIMFYNRKLLKNVTGCSPEVEEIFQQYSWPGNVRELQHAVEHAMNVMPVYSGTITARVLPDHIVEAVQKTETKTEPEETLLNSIVPPMEEMEGSLNQMLENYERKILAAAMEKYQGNVSQAARALKTSRQQLKYRLDKYGI